MKAITIWQPYVQAIGLGLKRYETRSWATKYRGQIVIHASKRLLNKQRKLLAEKYGIKDCPLGKVLLVADLTDCILMTEDFIQAQKKSELDFGNWQIGRYAWKLENIKFWEMPIEISGQQGLWNFKS